MMGMDRSERLRVRRRTNPFRTSEKQALLLTGSKENADHSTLSSAAAAAHAAAAVRGFQDSHFGHSFWIMGV